jgi:hypothetical protein
MLYVLWWSLVSYGASRTAWLGAIFVEKRLVIGLLYLIGELSQRTWAMK